MTATIHTLRAGNTLPPALPPGAIPLPANTCDQLGICHFPQMDCNATTCHRSKLADGVVDVPVDVPLPATLAAAGNFWPDLATVSTSPNCAKPAKAIQPPDVTPPPDGSYLAMRPHWRDTGWDTAFYWFWVAAGYLFTIGLAGYAWGRWGDAAVRAFWRTVAGLS